MTARHISAVLRASVLIVVRDPAPNIVYVVLPTTLMLVMNLALRPGLGARAAAVQAGTGQAVMFSLFALGVAAGQLHLERRLRTLDQLRMSGAGSGEILVGKLVPLATVLLVQQGILLAAAALAIDMPLGPDPWLLVPIVLPWAACLLGAAAALALLAHTSGQVAAAKDVGAMTLGVLGGAMIPISLLPDPMAEMASTLPSHWALKGYQAALAGNGDLVLQNGCLLTALGASLWWLSAVLLSRLSRRALT